MRVHILQHVPFEGPGHIASWARSAKHLLTFTRFFESDTLPKPESVDFLIVMGGPMSVNDEDRFPWLVDEKRFVRACIEEGKAVLGICLGAQLIANALGASVYPNRFREIGWFSISGLVHNDGDLFHFAEKEMAFHWHGETFDLPQKAVHLAVSEGCLHQAFQIGRSVVGLQFHWEVTREGVQALVEHGASDLKAGRYVQTKEEILSASDDRYAKIHRRMEAVLNHLAESQLR